MCEVRFYHLVRISQEQVVPKLLELTLQRGKKAIVRCGSPQAVQFWQERLWLYADQSFLPHGSGNDPMAQDQPVWITDQEDNPNNASYEFLLDGVEYKERGQERSAVIFDGRDETALEQARKQWKALQGGDFKLSYWQQNNKGIWEQKS